MNGVVSLLFVGVFIAQVPISILVYFDARRLGLKNPAMYYLGILVPAAGFVVIPVYVSKRGELPRENEPER
ncbi:hypothetical protein ACLI4Z_09900 [Natrialbaceae archaeon A-arb3/5]